MANLPRSYQAGGMTLSHNQVRMGLSRSLGHSLLRLRCIVQPTDTKHRTRQVCVVGYISAECAHSEPSQRGRRKMGVDWLGS